MIGHNAVSGTHKCTCELVSQIPLSVGLSMRKIDIRPGIPRFAFQRGSQRISFHGLAISDEVAPLRGSLTQLLSSVEILCEGCFYGCKSLKSVTFEDGSCLKRIEKHAFSGSVIESIEIPKGVEIDGSMLSRPR